MKNIKKPIGDLRIHLLLISATIVALFPMFYALSVSLMSKREILSAGINLFPDNVSLENYELLIRQFPIGRYMLNSLLVATVCSFVRTVLGAMAGYALSFFDFKGKNLCFWLISGTALLPQEALIVENYKTIAKLNLVNTYTGICSIYLVNAFNIILIYQSFNSYPHEIKDAADLDGCGSVFFFLKILLPTNGSTLIAVFLTSFSSLWNTYLWPMLVCNDDKMRTIQVALTMVKGRDSPDFGPVMAGVVIALLPSLVLFVLARESIQNNLER